MYFDSNAKIDTTPKYYLRPHYYELLYLCGKIPNCIVVLWSLGCDTYVQDAMFQTNMNRFFHVILARSDADESYNKYGVRKSYLYLLEKLGLHNHTRKIYSVLVDDKAEQNSKSTEMSGYSYTHLITLKKFDSKVILATLCKEHNDHVLIQVYKLITDFYFKYKYV